MKRLIFHVDVNSAFLSWEAALRVSQGREDIRLIPSAIGGDRDKRTGVILAKSIPAKRVGIKTGEPVAMALRKCPELYLAKPNFKLYEECSNAFMDICRRYAPVVEKYSIDECFLDMSGTERIYSAPIKTAYEIKEKIKQELGFTVNIGVGSNKLLAKMASDFEKPDKVHTLFDYEIERKMWGLPVRELFTIGSATAEKLERSYINTIGELAKLDINVLRSMVGVKLSEHLHAYANGIDDSEVSEDAARAKGYSNSTTLENDVTTAEDAYRILLALSDITATRMRTDGARAFCISVTVRTNNFKDSSHQRKLNAPTDITNEIFKVTKELFSELWDKKTPLRLLGVALTNITYDEDVQLSLFDTNSNDKARTLDKTVDSLRSKFGADAIVRGGTFGAGSRVGKKHKAQIETQINKK